MSSLRDNNRRPHEVKANDATVVIKFEPGGSLLNSFKKVESVSFPERGAIGFENRRQKDRLNTRVFVNIINALAFTLSTTGTNERRPRRFFAPFMREPDVPKSRKASVNRREFFFRRPNRLLRLCYACFSSRER